MPSLTQVTSAVPDSGVDSSADHGLGRKLTITQRQVGNNISIK